jgi:hypothetical protein
MMTEDDEALMNTKRQQAAGSPTYEASYCREVLC